MNNNFKCDACHLNLADGHKCVRWLQTLNMTYTICLVYLLWVLWGDTLTRKQTRAWTHTVHSKVPCIQWTYRIWHWKTHKLPHYINLLEFKSMMCCFIHLIYWFKQTLLNKMELWLFVFFTDLKCKRDCSFFQCLCFWIHLCSAGRVK